MQMTNPHPNSKLGQILIQVMTNLHPGHDKTCTCPRRAHIYCPNDGALLLSDILTHTPSKRAPKTFVEYVQYNILTYTPRIYSYTHDEH